MPEHSSHALILQGEALFEQGAYLDALDAFERVLEADPDDVHALNDAGLTAGELDQTKMAVEYFERALALQPDFEAAFFGMLDVLLDAGNVEAAVHAFLRYEEAIPNTPEKQRYADVLTHVTAPERPHADEIQRAEGLLMQDQPAEALAVLREVLKQDPENAHALNDAGHAYVELGEAIEATRCFEQALEADPTHQSAFYSLLDLLVRAETPELAVDVFLRYHEQMPDDEEKAKYADALGGWAEQQTAQAASGDSLPGEAYVSAASFPAPASSDGLRIAIVCGPDRKFITDIEEGLRDRGHAVHACYFDKQVDLQRIQQAMDWADVTWFEWCDQILVHASQKLRKTSAVVCRLHRYEVFSNNPQLIDWDFVDTLVFVTPAIFDLLKKRFPEVEQHIDAEIINNGVNLERFSFKEREPGFELAYVGYLHHRKNPSLLLQCMHALVQRDARYRLHIAGYHQQPEWELYFDHMLDELHLRNHVIMHGWVDDIQHWLDDKQYLLSTSIHEGHPYGVLEGTARGLKPVIHNFVHAGQLYPREWLFGSVEEFIQRVADDPFESHAYRQYIQQHYAFDDQLDRIDTVVRQVAEATQEAIPATASTTRQAQHGAARSDAHPPSAVLPDALGETDEQTPHLPAKQLWKTFEPAWKPYLAGEVFDNGLRVRFGDAEEALPIRPEFLEDIVRGKSILDLGCTDHAPLIAQKANHNRWLHKRLAATSARCLGIDIDEAGIEAAAALGYTVMNLNVVTDPVPEVISSQRWDYIILGEVLEHIGDPVAFLSAIREKYEPYVESIVVTVPNGLRVENQHFARHGLEIINSDHRFWFSPYTLAKVMMDAGLQLEGYRLIQGYRPTNQQTSELLKQYPLLRDGVAMVAHLS